MARIRVLHDDADTQQAIEALLTVEGHEVVTGDAELLVTDRADVARRLRRSATPVVYASAWDLDADLPMPFVAGRLLQLIRETLS